MTTGPGSRGRGSPSGPAARVDVPVEPLAEERFDRIERRLLAERERERLATPPVDLRRGVRRLALATSLVVGVAAGAGVMWLRGASPAGGPAPASLEAARGGASAPAAPLLVRTPADAPVELALGGASVRVAGGSEATVEQAADGAVTLRLARGAVDCEVEPRPGRAPFHVVADDVVVTVVGTQFSVARDESVRVSVRRGKVRVAAPGGERLVAAGQAWDRRDGEVVQVAALAPAGPGGAGDVDGAGRGGAGAQPPAPVAPAGPAADAGVAEAALAAAVAVEQRDPDAAARGYAEAALAGGASGEEAAYRLARLELSRQRWDATLDAVRLYEQQYPRGAHLEPVLWFRVEANCGFYRSRAAEAAARAYLKKFPDGPHAAQARESAVCRGI